MADELLAFGYGARLFRDDGAAAAVNTGEELFEWHGVLIDKFDVRSLLDDDHGLSARPWDEGDLSSAELSEEIACDAERYRDLEQAMERDAERREAERKRDAEAAGAAPLLDPASVFSRGGSPDPGTTRGAGVEIAFSYDTPSGGSTQRDGDRWGRAESPDSEDDNMDQFFPPELKLLPGTKVPQSRKQLAVIHRTAKFVAGQSLQMEIVLKAKQANNPRFRFLTFGHRLNPFYKHLLERIREGYAPPEIPTAPPPPETPAAADADADAGGGHAEDVPEGEKGEENSTGLVNTGGLVPYDDGSSSDEGGAEAEATVGEGSGASSAVVAEAPTKDEDEAGPMVTPPPELKLVVDKLAAYVADNGPAFAERVRQEKSGDPRFAFLSPSDQHHRYYRSIIASSSAQQLSESSIASGGGKSVGDSRLSTDSPPTTAAGGASKGRWGVRPGQRVAGKSDGKKKATVPVEIVRAVVGGQAASPASPSIDPAEAKRRDRQKRAQAFVQKLKQSGAVPSEANQHSGPATSSGSVASTVARQWSPPPDTERSTQKRKAPLENVESSDDVSSEDEDRPLPVIVIADKPRKKRKSEAEEATEAAGAAPTGVPPKQVVSSANDLLKKLREARARR